jgi:hypothetical protein
VRITYDPGRAGYARVMLAVVVLVPIALMILACSLERFEALTTRVAPVPRAPRGQVPAVTTAPPLRLVPGAGTDAVEPVATDEDLRRAS